MFTTLSSSKCISWFRSATLIMRLKENTLTLVCLLSSLSGLALVYIAAINIEPRQLPLSEITFELVGRSVETSGYISYKSEHPNGHVFLTINDGDAAVQVPLFAGYMNALEKNGIDEGDFRKGDVIAVRGLIGEYRDQLQIIPRTADDIKILSDGFVD